VRATRGCIRDRGLPETSSRAIADAAGVNLAAITYYFGSKDDLVAVALADELREWTQPALDLLAQPGDPVHRLLGAVTIVNEAFDEQRDRIPGLLETFVHAARDRAARGPNVAIWVEVRTQLSAAIAELRSAGAIPAWVEPDAMASLIIAVAAGTVVNETIDPDGAGHRQVAAQFAALLIGRRLTSSGGSVG
jgi:AcrR family transcriptional regulator